ncbi:MAG: discoidin domain-containing protein, partial [Pseudorhodoplanes sp.]
PELYFVGGRATGFAKVNFEAKDRYEITVTVTDSSGTSSIDYEINVVDKNDNAPLFTSPDHIFFEAGSDPSVVIYRATATDRDTVTNIDAADPTVVLVNSVVGDTVQFSLAAPGGVNNNDNNYFTMSNNGEVKIGGIAGTPTAGTYTLEVIGSDGVQSTTDLVSVTVTPAAAPINLTDTFGSMMTISQSSIYSGAYSAADVLDNDIATFNHTQNGPNEWIKLDFGGAFDVTAIEIVNRWDVGARLEGAVVTLLDASGSAIAGFEATVVGAENGETFTFSTGAPVTAYGVQITGTPNEYLHIAELDVLGYTPPNFTPTVNLTDTFKDQMTISQSSIYSGAYSAADVLDNDITTFNHTQNGPNEWIKLDFGGAFDVTAIEIVNRWDVGTRLEGAVVTLLDASGNAIAGFDATVVGAENGETFTFSTGAPVMAYGVQITGTPNEYLHIAELDVFGYDLVA